MCDVLAAGVSPAGAGRAPPAPARAAGRAAARRPVRGRAPGGRRRAQVSRTRAGGPGGGQLPVRSAGGVRWEMTGIFIGRYCIDFAGSVMQYACH